MKVFGVTLDWQIIETAFGIPAMYDCRNINYTRQQAEEWIAANKPETEK